MSPTNSSPQTPTLVVTGAHELVGAAVVERALARGWKVVAAVHDAALALPWASGGGREGVDLRVGRIEDASFARALMQGALYVVHADLQVDLRADYGALAEHNVKATAQLYEAAGNAGVRHFTHISTATIYAVKRAEVDERAPRFAASPYEQTCIDAENVLMDLAEESDTWLTVLRPGFVYGPGGRCAVGSIAAAMATIAQVVGYMPGLVGGPRSHWIHAEDLADAALIVLGRQEAHREYYNVGDERPVAWGDVFTQVTSALGVPVGPILTWPPQMVVNTLLTFAEQGVITATLDTFLQKAWEMVCRKYDLRLRLDPALTRGALAWMRQDMSISSARIRTLGFVPRHGSLHDGVPATISWYRAARWLPEAPERATPQPSDGIKVRFQETLHGWATRTGDSTRLAVSLALTIEAPMTSVTEGVLFLDGRISVEGVCVDACVEGTLSTPTLSRRELSYEFAFSDQVGGSHRFAGRRGLPSTIFDIIRAWTSMAFTVEDAEGRLWLSGELGLDLRALLSFLTSPRVDMGSD